MRGDSKRKNNNFHCEQTKAVLLHERMCKAKVAATNLLPSGNDAQIFVLRQRSQCSGQSGRLQGQVKSCCGSAFRSQGCVRDFSLKVLVGWKLKLEGKAVDPHQRAYVRSIV